jgi:hypothetical protein
VSAYTVPAAAQLVFSEAVVLRVLHALLPKHPCRQKESTWL